MTNSLDRARLDSRRPVITLSIANGTTQRLRKRWFGLDHGVLLVVGVAFCLTLPVLTVALIALLQPADPTWRHLVDTVLADYVLNSLWLMLGVGVGALAIGAPAAWLVSLHEFPGRRWLEWALLLPMAAPAYIVAYTYTGLLDYAGPVQSLLREQLYGQDYWFPEIRSLPGAIIMLTLVLYPYVYLLARAAFVDQSVTVLEVSRNLGAGPLRRFIAVALPLARPALIAGVSLAQMEALADYGTVQYFGVDTFTTGIFRVWYGMNDPVAAAQLAALLLLCVFALLVFERTSRRQARFHHAGSRHYRPHRQPLTGRMSWLACAVCLIPLLFGFVIPALQLVAWTLRTAPQIMDERFWPLLTRSMLLAAGTALVVLALALLLGYGLRLRPHPLVRLAVRTAALGYAVPGTVAAIGVLLPLAALERSVDGWARQWLGMSTGLLLSGTVVALLLTYCTRFLPVALQSVEAGLSRIRPSMDDAARALGASPKGVLVRIHLPMLRGSLWVAVLLVFIDTLKELPATLILRPFNFNTLAVRTYELASDERLADSASFALAIVLAGIGPVILLSRAISRAVSSDDAVP